MNRLGRLAAWTVTCAAAFAFLLPSIAYGALDGYERIGLVPPYAWDNSPGNATPMPLGTQIHTFQTLDVAFLAHDEDWVKFDATAGSVYSLQAQQSNGSGANPVIFLYGTNGTTIMAVSDDAVLSLNVARIGWTCPATGTYYLRLVDWYGPSTGAEYRIDVSYRGNFPPVPVHRPDAPDRYTLAANLGLAGWPGWTGVTDVVIACGADRTAADPLAASGLAGVYDAPILLVQNDPTRVAVPAATKSALSAIAAATGSKPQIHVVGGPASVTAGHIAVLKAYDKDGAIDRIGGADRYAVAAGIAARMRSKLGSGFPKTTLFCNGHDAAYFWNALAAGPIAFRQHFPILLTTLSGVPAATSGQKSFYATRYVMGTPADTRASVLSALGATRIGWDASDGASYDRTIVARRITETGGDRDWIGYGDAFSFTDVAYANKLADALVGGAFAGKKDGGLLFSFSANYLDMPVMHPFYVGRPTGTNSEFLVARRDFSQDAWILGGTSSVSDSVRTEMAELLGSVTP